MQKGEDTGSRSPAAIPPSHERKIVLLLCALAAIHVFIFSAAFPFFNNVDEAIHFDVILKYAQGHFPRSRERISADSAGYLALMNSHAYLWVPANFPNGRLPPPAWTQPAEKAQQDLARRSANWQTQENYEISQPPLYYTLAGIWWDVGRGMGLHDGRLVYWLRFLNIIAVAALVYLAYYAARTIFPENLFVRLGTPALLAFMPQTAFYSLNDDMASAPGFTVVFICLVKWLSSEKPSALLGAVTGVAFAATYFAKVTNLPLLVIAVAVVLVKTAHSFRREKGKACLPALIAFLFCAELPIVPSMMWCKSHYGDLTGSSIKISFLGWTIKPFDQWWHHPIFTPQGFWTYLSGQLSSFWQGEFCWHSQPMALPESVLIYTLFSLALLMAAIPALFPRFSPATAPQRHSLQLCACCVAIGLIFYALLSIVYDFHNCPYPSRSYPYFVSGRMRIGALVPFLLLTACGLDRLLSRLGNSAKFLALTAIIAVMLASEIVTDWPAFANEYNWFHLP
jgi:hypothetical protein